MGKSKRHIAVASCISSDASCAWASWRSSRNASKGSVTPARSTRHLSSDSTLRFAQGKSRLASRRGGLIASLVGHGPADGRIAHSSRMVAGLLPFLSPAPVPAASARCATTATGQATPTSVCVTHAGDGSWTHASHLGSGGIVSVPCRSVT